MDFLEIFKFVAALGLVLSLIGGCAWIATRLNLLSNFSRSSGTPRLGVLETLIIDAKHRLVIVSDDDREHVLLFGPSGDLVIESKKTTKTLAEVADPHTDQSTEDQTIIAMVKEGGQ